MFLSLFTRWFPPKTSSTTSSSSSVQTLVSTGSNNAKYHNTNLNSLTSNAIFGSVKWAFAFSLLASMVFFFLVHISLGATKIPLEKVWNALIHFNHKNFSHIIIWDLRLPRAVIALTVGGALAVAGALMQGITRNPLADPGLLGLMHGASFAAVIAISMFGINSAQWLPLIAAFGSLVASMLVWLIAILAKSGNTALTLVLSGVSVTAFLGAAISLIKFADNDTFDNLRHWLVGSLSGRNLTIYWYSLPWIILGFILSVIVSRQITIFSMGDETATSLGINIGTLKTLILVAVVMLTAASVALVGPLGFVGLVIPHVVRIFVGYDYRFIIPFSALMGAVYVLVVDILARWIIAPIDITTGIITAIFGAPLFVWLVRVKL